jgi:hypothetical protein
MVADRVRHIALFVKDNDRHRWTNVLVGSQIATIMDFVDNLLEVVSRLAELVRGLP